MTAAARRVVRNRFPAGMMAHLGFPGLSWTMALSPFHFEIPIIPDFPCSARRQHSRPPTLGNGHWHDTGWMPSPPSCSTKTINAHGVTCLACIFPAVQRERPNPHATSSGCSSARTKLNTTHLEGIYAVRTLDALINGTMVHVRR